MKYGSEIKDKKVIVVQHGSRHRYIIPSLLQQKGLLAAVFTDSSEVSMLGKVSKLFNWLPVKKIKTLSNRKIKHIPKEKVFSTDKNLYRELTYKLLKKDFTCYSRWCSGLSSKSIVWLKKFENVSYVYNMYAENIELIRYIKLNTSIKVITDVYIHPNTMEIMNAESKRLGVNYEHGVGIQNIDISYIKEVISLSDVLLCPSNFVANGVLEIDNTVKNKIVVSPYGSSINYHDKISIPVRGRVLWAGGDWLRKGLHILHDASILVKENNDEVEFCIAGLSNNSLPKKIPSHNFNFLGKLTSSEMRDCFLTTDVFVLPTFSEGMSGVVIEALSAGCPVITTAAAGIDQIVDGVNGFIIPEGDSELLAQRIQEIITDRELRFNMSNQAKIMANYYNIDDWSERLNNLLR